LPNIVREFLRTLSRKAFVPILFLILAICYFWNAVSAQYVFVERDLAPFFIPPKLLWVSLAWLAELPLWNPYNYSGIPLLATLQPGVFYPPHIFYLLLPFNIAWNWLTILHFAFAGINLYFLLRYLKVSQAGSFAGGIVFMLSGYLLSVHNLQPHLFAVTWFPLVVLFSIKSLESSRGKEAVYTALFLTMEFLAGAPEIAMMTVLILILLTYFSEGFVKTQPSWFKKGKILAGILIMFLLLISIQFIPFYELKRQSIRLSGLSYEEAVTWSFAWKDFMLFFMPDAFGYAQTTEKYWSNQSWLKTVYLGIAPFILSMFYFSERDKKKWCLLGLAILSFLFAFGGNTPIYKYLHFVPPFSSVRFPVKFLFLFFFVIAITSGIGLDKLKQGIENNEKKARTLALISFYFGFLFALCWGALYLFNTDIAGYLDLHNYKPPSYNEIWFNLHNLKRFFLFSFVFCLIPLIYLRVKARKAIIMVSIVLLLTADLFLANFGFYSLSSWQWFISRQGFVEYLQPNQETERYFVTLKTENELEYINYGKIALTSPYASMFGFYSTGGSEVMKILHHSNFISMIYCGRTIHDAGRFFDVAGVRYMTTSYEVNNKDYKLLRSEKLGDKEAYLYEYKNYPGRFFVYGRATFVGDDKIAIAKLTDDKIDLRKELIIVDNNKGNQSVDTNAKGTVTLVSYRPNKVILESNADNNAFLYLSDTYYPGWRAYVDGKETKIYRANLAFRAVEVPKGKHTVVFKYVPMSFYIGLCLTIFGILLCIYLWRRDRTTVNRES
jgi:hypothetical protein